MRMRAFESVLNDLGLVEDGEGVGRWEETNRKKALGSACSSSRASVKRTRRDRSKIFS